MNSRALGMALAAVLAACATPASAHTRSVSYSAWTLESEAGKIRGHVVVRIPQLELTRLPWGPVAAPQLDPALAHYLTSRLAMSAAGEACSVTDGPRALAATAGNARFEWRVACATAGPLELRSGILLEVASGHLHFARLRQPGSQTLERVLSTAEPSWVLEPGAGPAAARAVPASIGDYVRLGIEHIWTGYDHLAFLLALILLAQRLRDVAALVTGFTVAHSLTLALSVLGALRLPGHTVEALIGFSIAIVAAENAWQEGGGSRGLVAVVAGGLGAMALAAFLGAGAIPGTALAGLALFSVCYFGLLERTEQSGRLRAAVAFVFGLLHGFGFAEVLADLELPRSRLTPALFGFNLGVELGQLGVVAALWPGLRWLRTRPGRFTRPLLDATSATICGLGLFWLVTRTYG